MKTLPLLGLLILAVCCKPNQKEDSKEVAQAQVEIKTEEVVVKEEPLLAPKILIENVELKCYGTQSRAAAIFGSGVRITCKITNNSDIGIKKAFLKGDFKYKGRSISYTNNLNYEFRKGLEPGETQELAMRPNVMSDWNDNIKPGDQGDFTLEVLAVEDYNGNRKK